MIFKEFIKLILSLIKDNFKYILIALAIIFVINGGNRLIRDYYLNAEQKIEDGKTVVIGVLKDENLVLKDKIETISDNSLIDDREIVVNIDEKEGIRKDTDKARERLSETISKIHEQYKDVPSMTDTNMKDTLTKQKAQEIATAQIDSLWMSYCAGTTDEPDCKGSM